MKADFYLTRLVVTYNFTPIAAASRFSNSFRCSTDLWLPKNILVCILVNVTCTTHRYYVASMVRTASVSVFELFSLFVITADWQFFPTGDSRILTLSILSINKSTLLLIWHLCFSSSRSNYNFIALICVQCLPCIKCLPNLSNLVSKEACNYFRPFFLPCLLKVSQFHQFFDFTMCVATLLWSALLLFYSDIELIWNVYMPYMMFYCDLRFLKSKLQTTAYDNIPKSYMYVIVHELYM